MTSGEFHQLVALLQGQFMQMDRRLSQVLGHVDDISRRLGRLEQAAMPSTRDEARERPARE
jgi:hypothetical protein